MTRSNENIHELLCALIIAIRDHHYTMPVSSISIFYFDTHLFPLHSIILYSHGKDNHVTYHDGAIPNLKVSTRS